MGAVVAVGDSLTDGATNNATGVLDSTDGRDADARYTDWLARRLRDAGRPLSVLNAGISGNKLLRDGAEGGNFESFGPALLKRLDADVLQQAGATTVLLWSGINDVSQTPRATPEEVEAGYRTAIDRLHAAGLRVLQATLSPFKGYPPTLASGEADEEVRRQAVNAWIRAKSPADAVLDFDAVLRDPADPSRLDPRWDDGEHLHLSSAGYRHLAASIPLDLLADPACAHTLRVTVTPRRPRAGRLTTLRVTVREDGAALAGATVRVARARARSGPGGVGRLRIRFATTGTKTVGVSAPDGTRRRVHVRVVR